MLEKLRTVWRALFAVILALEFTVSAGSASDQPSASTGVEKGTVVVTGESLGQLPASVGAGLFVYECGGKERKLWNDVAVPLLIKDSRPGNVRVGPCFAYLSEKPSTDEELDRKIASVVGPDLSVARPLLERGWTLSHDLFLVPRWLSAHPDNENPHPNAQWTYAWARSKPSDYGEWRHLITHWVNYFSEHGVHPWYGVWNEPNWEFFDSLEDYLELYRTTSIAVKLADPEAKVGGPCVSNFNEPKWLYDEAWHVVGNSGEPMTKSLIYYVARTPAPELGMDHLPLDFIDVHFPGLPDNFEPLINTIRGWLEDAGLDPDSVAIRFGEWTWPPGKLGASKVSASYVLASIIKMAELSRKYNITIYHNLTSFHDQLQWKEGEEGSFAYVGYVSTGPHHPNGIIRPKLNAYRMLGKLGDEVIKAETTAPNIYVLATKDPDGGVAVLITNFPITSPQTVRRELKEALVREAGLSEEEANEFLSCVRGTLKAKGGKFLALTEEEAEKLVHWCAPELDEKKRGEMVALFRRERDKHRKMATEPWEGEIRVKWTGKVGHAYWWRIDDYHANSCAYNRRTAETANAEHPCGVDGALDRAWEKAVLKARERAVNYLKEQGWTEEDINTLEEAINACKGEETRAETLKCVAGKIKVKKTALPEGATEDAREAAELYFKTLNKEENQLRERFNSMPEITLTREEFPSSALQEADGYLILHITLHPYDSVLLRLSHR